MRVRELIGPMVGLALAIGLVLAMTPAITAAPSHAWTRQFGTAEFDSVEASAVDSARNVYVVGETQGAFAGQLPRGNIDAFVRKYRPNGSVAWTRQFGTTSRDSASAVAVDSSGKIYVAGTTAGVLPGQTSQGGSDAFLRKLRPDGSTIWTRQLGTAAADVAYGIAIDRAGRIYLAGHTWGAFPGRVSKGGADAYVRKYRPDGGVAWTRQLGTAGIDSAAAIAVDRSGRIYVAGMTDRALPGQTSRGEQDAFVRRYRPDGRVAWTRQFGTSGNDQALGIAVDRSGRIYVAGCTIGRLPGQTSNGSYDSFVRRYRPDGSVAWTRQFGTTDWDCANGLSTAPAGRIYVAEQTGGDALVRKLHPDGRSRWVRQIGRDASGESARDVSVDRAGNLYVVGNTSDRLPGQTAKGSWDAFLRKYRH